MPINDSLRDNMLYRITRSDPWYANIVNFMVAGYVPLGADKKFSSTRIVTTYGMSRTSLKSAQMDSLDDVY
jgi:hypothetical protein